MLATKMATITTNDLKTVYSRTYKARNKWSNILLALDMSNDTIESIGKTHHGSPDDCYRMGLSEWLSSGSRSWQDMVQALSCPTVGHNDIAIAIKEEYLGPTETKPDSTAIGEPAKIWQSACVLVCVSPTYLYIDLSFRVT